MLKNDQVIFYTLLSLTCQSLNAKNKRFILKNLNEHFKFSRHENSFTWLRDADMALPTHCAEEPKVPLEVKSGKDYARHVALNNVMKNAEYGINEAIVLCNDNLSIRGNVTYAPIYMLMFIDTTSNELLLDL